MFLGLKEYEASYEEGKDFTKPHIIQDMCLCLDKITL